MSDPPFVPLGRSASNLELLDLVCDDELPLVDKYYRARQLIAAGADPYCSGAFDFVDDRLRKHLQRCHLKAKDRRM